MDVNECACASLNKREKESIEEMAIRRSHSILIGFAAHSGDKHVVSACVHVCGTVAALIQR